MLKTIKLSLAVSASLLMLATTPASAQQNYWLLKAVPSLKPVGGAGSGPVAPKVELAAGLLPDGIEGKPYSFDLKTLTQVTAGPGMGSVQYALAGGTLPAGVSLSNDGLLAGTPTAITAPEGAGFTVLGTYVTATGQQAYTIKVGESVLSAVTISGGLSHACAITTEGAAKCWGANTNGRLGNGTEISSTTPVQVQGLTTGVTSISAGTSHTCAIVVGAAMCWGSGSYGKLGNSSTSSSNTPVQVQGLASGVTKISAGGVHTCAVVSGAAKCWGQGFQLGTGSFSNSSVAVQVSGLESNVMDISAGNSHTCAIREGRAWCWGFGSGGVLGNGSGSDAFTPVEVAEQYGVTSIAAGSSHTCAVVSGAAVCWGSGGSGKLGNGVTASYEFPPATVQGLTSGVSHISVGTHHTCAVVSGAVMCWGDNGSGQLGDGTTTASNVPLPVIGLASPVSSLTLGGTHTCAKTSASSISCWGHNSAGQLGNGTKVSSSVPMAVKAGN